MFKIGNKRFADNFKICKGGWWDGRFKAIYKKLLGIFFGT